MLYALITQDVIIISSAVITNCVYTHIPNIV